MKAVQVHIFLIRLLSDYSLLIAKAHVFNKNYDLATKWISFAESYVSQTDEFNEEDLNNIKFLYDLYKSEDKITFIKVLENDFTNSFESQIQDVIFKFMVCSIYDKE